MKPLKASYCAYSVVKSLALTYQAQHDLVWLTSPVPSHTAIPLTSCPLFMLLLARMAFLSAFLPIIQEGK